MKISEMSLEQLQDYAVQLESENGSLSEELQKKSEELNEANQLNRQLQQRNNALFLQVEQQSIVEKEKEEQEEQKESCEDFARKLVEGGKI